jgi:hypothetical protein
MRNSERAFTALALSSAKKLGTARIHGAFYQVFSIFLTRKFIDYS